MLDKRVGLALRVGELALCQTLAGVELRVETGLGDVITVFLTVLITAVTAGVLRLSVLRFGRRLPVLAGVAPLGNGRGDGEADVGASLVQLGVGAVLVLAVLDILGLPAFLVLRRAATIRVSTVRGVCYFRVSKVKTYIGEEERGEEFPSVGSIKCSGSEYLHEKMCFNKKKSEEKIKCAKCDGCGRLMYSNGANSSLVKI